MILKSPLAKFGNFNMPCKKEITLNNDSYIILFRKTSLFFEILLRLFCLLKLFETSFFFKKQQGCELKRIIIWFKRFVLSWIILIRILANCKKH